ncbi:hypothetical protein LCGC14_0631240 [marine sediment metagenome]|uniref:HEPN domain-containing protein n=1 Tax=marine sediment metagenome TaxID=412755 RepID=A0A0F9RLC9_9ZZZZ
MVDIQVSRMHNFNLVENAKDSLHHAIEHMGPVNSNSSGDWKRIIVDLAHVLELLFKEKLRQIHPAFVFKDVDKYNSSKAFTVSADLAVQRLEKIGKIVFSEGDKKEIRSASSNKQ